MKEIKEIFESIGTRIRSPFFGYFFFVAVFLNWKVWFFVLFADAPVLDRFQYFDNNTSLKSLLLVPLVLGFLLAIVSPWTRWFFVWAAQYPTTNRVLVQAKSEQNILDGKNDMALARASLQTTQEESLISEAKRDVEIKEIPDDDVRRKLQSQIDELRQTMHDNDMRAQDVVDSSLVNAALKMDLVKAGGGYRFQITNIGHSVARNIRFELTLENEEDDPIPRSEYEKLPIPMLSAGSSFSLLAAIHLGSPTSYTATISWDNPDGSRTREMLHASL